MTTDKPAGKKKSKSVNRYPGTEDGASWKVSYTVKPTVKVKDETFNSFTAAQAAATQYIDATGMHAGAVRA